YTTLFRSVFSFHSRTFFRFQNSRHRGKAGLCRGSHFYDDSNSRGDLPCNDHGCDGPWQRYVETILLDVGQSSFRNGLKTITPKPVKSRTFRVATVQPCARAVAAMSESR